MGGDPLPPRAGVADRRRLAEATAPPPPRSTTKPAWTKPEPKPTTAKRRWPWTVEFRPDAKPRHTIRLSCEGCRAIEANAALAAAAGVETGGYGWTFRPTRLTGREAIVEAVLLGDSKRVAADHYVYALTDYREVDRSIALARASA